MAEENQQNKEQGNQQVPPPSPPVASEKVDKIPNSKEGADNPSEEGKTRLDFPQPFIVKEEKEISKGIKRFKKSEIISFIALCVSIYAVTLNKCSLDNTTKSLAITDSTFKRNNVKDSLASISNRVKDSMNRIKDSINIDIAQKSFKQTSRANEQIIALSRKSTSISQETLQAQIDAIKKEQNRFEIENKGFPFIDNIRTDGRYPYVGNGYVVNYSITNIGKLPFKITRYKHSSLFIEKFDLSNVDSRLRSLAVLVGWKTKGITNITVPSGGIASYEEDIGLYPEDNLKFLNGESSLYVFVEIEYYTIGLQDKRTFSTIIRITHDPVFKLNFVELLNYKDDQN